MSKYCWLIVGWFWLHQCWQPETTVRLPSGIS